MPSDMGNKVAVVGIYETTYYKYGRAEDAEFKMGLEALMGVAADAGIDVGQIDGFSAYSNDRNDPVRFASALGLPDISVSMMQWGGGGGGGSGAMANAAAAIIAGLANYVVVYRVLAQGQFGRFGSAMGAQGGGPMPYPGNMTMPYGILSAAHSLAGMQGIRAMHENGMTQEMMRAVAMASYHHAQQNPAAVMYGRPLTEEAYDASRWIVEPLHLFDCCQENDGAAAILLTSMERARDLKRKPVRVLGAAVGHDYRFASGIHNGEGYTTANFKNTARKVFERAGVKPKDVNVLQSYENFSDLVAMSIVDCGFTTWAEAPKFFVPENLYAPSGKLPLNTSGGNLAHCYMHGLELNVEAVKQVRGESFNQVPNVKVSMVCSGPAVAPTTSVILGA